MFSEKVFFFFKLQLAVILPEGSATVFFQGGKDQQRFLLLFSGVILLRVQKLQRWEVLANRPPCRANDMLQPALVLESSTGSTLNLTVRLQYFFIMCCGTHNHVITCWHVQVVSGAWANSDIRRLCFMVILCWREQASVILHNVLCL